MMNDIKKNEEGLSLFDSFQSLFTDAFKREMKTDITETKDAYELSIEVPGIKKEDLEISFTDDTLTIHAKKNDKTKEENKSYIAKERSTLDMERSYYLENADEENITARMDNGILYVNVLKKKDIANPKKVINIE
jgi:HSP20 family protein